MRYTRPGVLRDAFRYQDLLAVEILIDFYRDRHRYAWVQVEAGGESFRSIEDVVACNPDGSFDLVQVKFTTDPNREGMELTWEWLTESKGDQGTSLLQKWSRTTLRHVSGGTLGTAALKTDRRPDAAFLRCLEGSKVDYDGISDDVKEIVDEQIGDAEAAREFFADFDFVHSLPLVDDLEETLRARVAADTDYGAWSAFLHRVARWATRVEEPAPDGKIRHYHLRDALSVGRPRPLPQDFQVPASYVVPDDEFDRQFLELLHSDGLCVLWGPPGRGKSTYLSACISRLEPALAVCIRHHYFLSVSDRSEGRFSFAAIDRSLRAQLGGLVLGPPVPGGGQLRSALEDAAERLGAGGVRLVVVVDGLDHVWRENRDHEEMEALFEALLPLPPNVRLVVGTQRVGEEHLPTRLLRVLDVNDWIELPVMSEPSVHRWLRRQDEREPLEVQKLGRQPRHRAIGALARALHGTSGGLPLHLIYSYQALVRLDRRVAVEDVADLPGCPTGEITDYYKSFWPRIGEEGQRILHVLAGLDFGPPPFAMEECFGSDGEGARALSGVRHLVHYQEAEVLPFHASLFTFVRDQDDHRERFRAHVGRMVAWLESAAPPPWRWAWLWITKARLGDTAELLAGPDREWAIASLVAGYSIEQVGLILDHAEKAAFEILDLAVLCRLRLLKQRVLSAAEFQTGTTARLRELAVSLGNDADLGALLRAELHGAPAAMVPGIVRSAAVDERQELAERALSELERRIRAASEDENVGVYDELADAIVNVAPVVKTLNPSRLVSFAQGLDSADGLLATYARAAIRNGTFENVFSVSERLSGPQLDREVLGALCLEGLSPSSMPRLKAQAHPAVRCLAMAMGAEAEAPRSRPDWSGVSAPDAFERFSVFHEVRGLAYEAFFGSLSAGLAGGVCEGWSRLETEAPVAWLQDGIRALEELAGSTAAAWRAHGRWPTLGTVYGSIGSSAQDVGSGLGARAFGGFRMAVRDIAVDLCTIGRGLDPRARISEEDLEMAATSRLWRDDLWFEEFGQRHLPLHAVEAARGLISRVQRRHESEIVPFNERAEASAKLATFAANHGLVDVAEEELNKTARCLLGYGWHKDLFALEVLESLDLLAGQGVGTARDTLRKLAGEFDAILSYTDGDETRYVPKQYYKTIAKYFPDLLAACYAYLIQEEQWWYAETVALEGLKAVVAESAAGRALLESYIGPEEARALAGEGDGSRSAEALMAVSTKLGTRVEDLAENPREDDEVRAEEVGSGLGSGGVTAVDLDSYPPGQLGQYVSAVSGPDRGYSEQADALTLWLRYWDAEGEAVEAVRDFEATYGERTYRHSLERSLDAVFEIAIGPLGRTRARAWLNEAQIRLHGWQPWMSGKEQALSRMRSVALYYRERWREFVQQTAKPVYRMGVDRNGLVIAPSRLVLFLVVVEERDLALACAQEMVRAFKEDLEGQALPTPRWSL